MAPALSRSLLSPKRLWSHSAPAYFGRVHLDARPLDSAAHAERRRAVEIHMAHGLPARRLRASSALLLSALASSAAVRILPLGDSITFGCGSDAAPPDWYACCNDASGGYRAPLWAFLNQSSAAAVQFVGSETNGPAWVPVAQRAHEGHPGWTISGIASLQPKWIAAQPDVVLLMAGTNDVGQGHSNASITSDMVALLAALRATLPKAQLLVTSILNLPDSSANGQKFPGQIANLNSELPALAKAVGAVFVDINGATGMCKPPADPLVNLCAVCNGPCGGYNPASCPPQGYSLCHPTGAGYELMAGVWGAALLPIISEAARAAL